MTTLISTPAGETSNSYVASVSEADEIAEEISALASLALDTAGWDAASDAAKTLALVIAAGRIDRIPTKDVPYSSTQALQYPTGSSASIRDEVKWAQVVEAIVLTTAPDAQSSMAIKGVQAWASGDESIEFSSAAKVAAERPASSAAESILTAAGLATSDSAGSVYTRR